MALVRSRILSQSNLFSCTPQLGRHQPGGISSGQSQQQRAQAASVFPTTLLVVSGHPLPGQSPRLPLRTRGLPYMEQWALYQQLLFMQTTSRMPQVSQPASQSQLPYRCHLLSSTLSLRFPPRTRGSSHACRVSTLHCFTFYSVSSVLCVFPLLQCFLQLYCGSATSYCVLTPSLQQQVRDLIQLS